MRKKNNLLITYMKKYTKNEAIIKSNEFIKDLIVIQEKYGMTINTDHNIYLSFLEKDKDGYVQYGSVDVGWEGDGTPIKVLDVIKDTEYHRKSALSKLSGDELSALGL